MMANWIKRYGEIPLECKNFQQILNFYLFQCPCETKKGSKKKDNITYSRVSARGSTLRQRGWTGRYLNTLLAAMKDTTSRQLTYYHFPGNKDIVSEVNSIERNSTLSDPDFEMIVIVERSDMSLTSSILYYIRNALAHGSFRVNGDVYSFESSKDGTMKAAIRLREKTLLKWIKDISLSPEKLKKALQSERKTTKKRKRAA